MYGLRNFLSIEDMFREYSQEQLMEYYLGIPVDFDSLVCSPLRNDTKPTAGFAYSQKGRLFFRDFSGHFFGDVFEVVKFKNNCSYMDALQIMSDDIEKRLIEGSKVVYEGERRRRSIRVSERKLNSYDYLYWYNYGVRDKMLEYAAVTGLNSAWVENSRVFTSSLTYPGFLYKFYHGVKAYMPNYRVRFLCNTLELQRLPHKHTGKTCIITKSYKDVIVCYTLGYHAVAPQSESTPITEAQWELLQSRFSNFILLYDNDEAGFLNAEKESLKLGIPSFYLDKAVAKDIAEFRMKCGREQAISILEKFTGDAPEDRDTSLYY